MLSEVSSSPNRGVQATRVNGRRPGGPYSRAIQAFLQHFIKIAKALDASYANAYSYACTEREDPDPLLRYAAHPGPCRPEAASWARSRREKREKKSIS